MADLFDLIWFGWMIVKYILGHFYFLCCALFELNVFVLLFIFVCVCVFIFYIWKNYFQDREANRFDYRRHEPPTDQLAFRRHEDIDVKLCHINITLNVTKILDHDVRLRDWTMKRHFYFGSSDTFGKQDAIQISIKRGPDFLEISNENTVYALPSGFMLCQIYDWKKSMVISKEPVKTYQCTYDRFNRNWKAEYKGEYFAIFDEDGRHFPGKTYKNVVFPNE